MAKSRFQSLFALLVFGFLLITTVLLFVHKSSPTSKEQVINAINKGHTAVLQQAAREKKWLSVKTLGAPPLHLAVKARNEDSLRTLLTLGLNPEERDEHGQTPLHLAAAGGDMLSLNILLDAKANPNVYDNAFQSPLVLAAKSHHLSLVRRLESRGARKEFWAAVYTSGNVRQFLENGHNPNLPNGEGKVPLTYALEQEDLTLVNALLPFLHHIQPAQRALFRCEWLRDTHQVLGPKDCRLLDLASASALSLLQRGDLPADCGIKPGATPLSQCAMETQSEPLLQLARQLGDPPPARSAAPSRYGNPAGYEMERCSWLYSLSPPAPDWFTAIQTQNTNQLKKAVNKQLPLKSDCSGFSSLHFAALKPNQNIAQILLSASVSINSRQWDGPSGAVAGDTPLITATLAENFDMAGFLLSKGADTTLSGLHHRSVFQAAMDANRPDFFSFLVEHAADLNRALEPGGETILHHAAKAGYRPPIELLLKYEAWPEVRDKAGRKPSDWAEAAGAYGAAQLLRDAEPAKPREKPIPLRTGPGEKAPAGAP